MASLRQVRSERKDAVRKLIQSLKPLSTNLNLLAKKARAITKRKTGVPDTNDLSALILLARNLDKSLDSIVNMLQSITGIFRSI